MQTPIPQNQTAARPSCNPSHGAHDGWQKTKPDKHPELAVDAALYQEIDLKATKKRGGEAYNNGRRHAGHRSINVPHWQMHDHVDGSHEARPSKINRDTGGSRQQTN